LVRRTSFKPK